MSRTKVVYLLHFDPPYRAPIAGTDRVKVAGHYLGSTAGTVDARLAEHVRGRGSPLVRAAILAGCEVKVVAIAPGSKVDERRLKRRHRNAAYCPECSPAPKPLGAPRGV